jgi:hypothetical protein
VAARERAGHLWWSLRASGSWDLSGDLLGTYICHPPILLLGAVLCCAVLCCASLLPIPWSILFSRKEGQKKKKEFGP